MDIRCELAAFVGVAEEIAYYGKYCAEDLGRDVPSVLHYLYLRVSSVILSFPFLTPSWHGNHD
jgi:uncharacterized membrane protein AbrB (regulator of aidB expression)